MKKEQVAAAPRIRLSRSRAGVGETVTVYTRSLDDITARLPEVVEAAAALPVEVVVLDGEVLALTPEGRPRPFQETAARSATRDADLAGATTLTPFFFDVLHVDGRDLLDAPLVERLEVLDSVAGAHVVERVVAQDADAAQAAFAGWVAAGWAVAETEGGR